MISRAKGKLLEMSDCKNAQLKEGNASEPVCRVQTYLKNLEPISKQDPKFLQAGRPLSGKDGVVSSLIKPLTAAALAMVISDADRMSHLDIGAIWAL